MLHGKSANLPIHKENKQEWLHKSIKCSAWAIDVIKRSERWMVIDETDGNFQKCALNVVFGHYSMMYIRVCRTAMSKQLLTTPTFWISDFLWHNFVAFYM